MTAAIPSQNSSSGKNSLKDEKADQYSFSLINPFSFNRFTISI